MAFPPPIADEAIDQETFWIRVSDYFQPYDIILTESGTPSSGGQDLILTPRARVINSALWMSIWYTLAASVGVALAQREMEEEYGIPAARIILFEGDGSFFK